MRASGANDFSEAHHFERHFLLGRAARLLPLQRDQNIDAIFTRDRINEVSAFAAKTTAGGDLLTARVAAASKRRKDHCLQHCAGVRVALRHRFRVANTSLAGVRSTVQLMRRGASWDSSAYPHLR